MFRDEFKSRYTSIPVAVYHGNYKHKQVKSILHQHKEIEVLTILEGEATFYIDSVSYNVRKGDLLIIPPYALHNALSREDAIFSHYCICFDLNIIHDKKLCRDLERGDLTITPFISGDNIFCEELNSMIKNVFFACNNKKTGWEFCAIGNISLFFGILEEYGLISSRNLKLNDKNFCMSVMEYINQNYNQFITSKDVASELFMNNSYFCRLFKKNFGNCFQNYLNIYRIEKSTILLRDTNDSVSEIAENVGFNSMSYYGKLFREIYGCSPSQYRKKFVF